MRRAGLSRARPPRSLAFASPSSAASRVASRPIVPADSNAATGVRSRNVAGSAASMRWPGGPAGQWKMSPFERISTSFSHSMARRPRVTSPQCGASHQPEVYPLRSPIRTRVMTYEDIRHVSTLISPGPTRSAETAGTTVGRLDADRTSKPCSMSRASLTSSSGSTGWNAASTSRSGRLEPVHRSAGGHVERATRRDGLPATPGHEGHLAVDDEAPVGDDRRVARATSRTSRCSVLRQGCRPSGRASRTRP